MIHWWTLLPAVLGLLLAVWVVATQRERKRCSEIARLRCGDHPSFDVRENGRAIRQDIWLGRDPTLYIFPERASQPSSPSQQPKRTSDNEP